MSTSLEAVAEVFPRVTYPFLGGGGGRGDFQKSLVRMPGGGNDFQLPVSMLGINIPAMWNEIWPTADSPYGLTP